MFIPFNIKRTTIEEICGNRYENYDIEYISNYLKSNINLETIKQSLINGTKLQEEWFPTNEQRFHVFISHSHRDECVAKQFAQYLREEYKLNCFIASVYWNYVEELQKQLDEYYSKVVRYGREVYDYKTSNFIAANVNIMLSMALMRMMDKCECLIFIDSDNSLIYKRGQSITPSPWIYEELGFSKYLRVNIPQRYKNRLSIIYEDIRDSTELLNLSRKIASSTFVYDVDIDHLMELEKDDITNLPYNGLDVLDELYKKYNIGRAISRLTSNE